MLRRGKRALGAVLTAACVAAPACTAGENQDLPRDAGERGQRSGLALLYADGSSLRTLELATGEDEKVTQLPSPDAYAAPARWIASVSDEAGPGDEDFAELPVVRLLDLASDQVRAVGAGFSPLWSDDGATLAWLRPVEERRCSGEICRGEAEVVSLDPRTMERRILLPAGAWGLLAWVGEWLLVSDARDLAATIAVSPEGQRATLALAPSEIWGGSPDGRWLLRVTSDGAEMLELADGAPTGHEVRVGGRSAALAEGSWSPDGSRLAVIELPRGGPGRVVVIEKGHAGASPVDGSRGAAGTILWLPDGDGLVFARTKRGARGRLEAVRCSVGGETPCEPLFSWREGVTLLRLQPAEPVRP
ncbi:MAG: TolB family protein [Actinomycetota bacterium]